MSAATTGKATVTLGGKTSTLNPTSVFKISNSQISIETSTLTRLSPPNPQSPTSNSILTFPEFLTVTESKSSILILLNKLLLSPSLCFSSSISPLLQILNQNSLPQTLTLPIPIDFHTSAAVSGITVLISHLSSRLVSLIDAVASISCEALKADVSCFNYLIDSGNGSSSKDVYSLCSDFRVFFNGSKCVGNGGKFFVDDSISEIPSSHGSFRECVRSVHLKSRVELSSGFSVGSVYDLSSVLCSLVVSLGRVGEISLKRCRFVVENGIGDEGVKGRLLEILGNTSVGDLEGIFAAFFKKDYVLFVHKVYELVGVVTEIVCWEAVVAFVALDGGEVFGENGSVVDVKKKKKKVVWGKGTTAFMQFIKDKLLLISGGEKTDLEKCAKDIVSLLDPRGEGFDDVSSKVKEIVESNESRRLPKLAKGTRDFAKEQMVIREKAFAIISKVFKRHGAMGLDTPVFELRETLMGKYGEDSKLIYDLADQGGELCSLRYDLTVPFARFVAMNSLTSFKRYQIAKVYRRDNPSKGRFREFYQCDFDIAGQFEKMGPDFEVIRILTELLDELDIGDYEVKLNHRKLLDGMLAICGVPQEKFRAICSSIDKLDKLTFEQIKKEMVEEKGLTEETANKIGTLVKHRGSPVELLSKLKEGSEFLQNSDAVLALDELEVLFKALVKSKCVNKVVFDLSLARGLDYYTGVIFEAVFKGATQVGSIAAGGRYDNLIGMFGTKQVPAVGISLGIERVFAIMEEKNKIQETRPTETEVLVSVLGDDLSLGAEFVSELWDADIKAEFLINKRVSKHIDRAIKSKIPYMVIIGEQELNKGTVKLKDVNALTEDEVPRIELLDELRRRLK